MLAPLPLQIHHRHQQGQCSAEPCAEGEDELQREGSRAGEGQGSGGGQGRREMGSAGAGAGAGAGSGAASGGKRQGTAGAGGGGGGRAAYGSAEHPGPGVPGGGGDSQGVEEAGAGAVGGLAAAPGKRRCVEGEGPSGASPGGAEGSGGDTGGYSSDVWDEGTDDTDAVEDGRDGGEGSGSGQGPDDGPAGEEGSRCRRFLSVPPTGGSLSGGRLGCLLYLAARAERQSLGLAEVAAATACDMSRLARIARCGVWGAKWGWALVRGQWGGDSGEGGAVGCRQKVAVLTRTAVLRACATRPWFVFIVMPRRAGTSPCGSSVFPYCTPHRVAPCAPYTDPLPRPVVLPVWRPLSPRYWNVLLGVLQVPHPLPILCIPIRPHTPGALPAHCTPCSLAPIVRCQSPSPALRFPPAHAGTRRPSCGCRCPLWTWRRWWGAWRGSCWTRRGRGEGAGRGS